MSKHTMLVICVCWIGACASSSGPERSRSEGDGADFREVPDSEHRPNPGVSRAGETNAGSRDAAGSPAGRPGRDAGMGGTNSDDESESGASAGASMSGAAGAGGETERSPRYGCGDVVRRIFEPKCGECHGPSKSLDLVSPGVDARVVRKRGEACSELLADPENPERSWIYAKLLPNPTCGEQMPIGRPALSDADIACVLSWIASQGD